MIPKILALIPTHNHHRVLDRIVRCIQSAGLDILIVDDGSHSETKVTLADLQEKYAFNLITLDKNQGKGAAVHHGFAWAKNNGYSHVFQIDADGQHDLDVLPDFLDLCRKNPTALISGQPVYDDSIPLARRIGRWFTHVWVWIETLSFRITDSMCGFRIYPIESSLCVMKTKSIGTRMDFDTQLMVHLFWYGVPVIMSPVRVIYPEGNTSNFDVIRDNWRITTMHTRLFLTMLLTWPKILMNRPCYSTLDLPQGSTHWASMSERAPILGIFFLAYCCRLLGKRLCLVIGAPVVLYYYWRNREQRQASQHFLSRAFVLGNRLCRPNSLYHFFSFYEMTLDKLAAWTGVMNFEKITYQSALTFENLMTSDVGAMLIVSHIGNMEFCRAVACADHKRRLHVLLHGKNSQRYRQMLKAFNPSSDLNVIEVTEVDPGTILFLKDRVDQGDWVVMAGDRVPVKESGRIVSVPFMGELARFSQGPYIMASLLECPVYMSTAIRDGKNISVHLEKLADQIKLDRANKEVSIRGYAQTFSAYLEKFAILYPYQWFNFFNFWK